MENNAQVASEMTVPVITNYSQVPVMTIVLQVLREKGKVKDPEEERKETVKEIMKEEMTSAWRVISFFVVVFVLPTLLISIPLYARYHLYHAKTAIFTDGDMNSFHSEISTFWCQGQRLSSNGTFDAYLTKEAKRMKRRTRVHKMSSELLLTLDDIEKWSIHLIQGSRFTLSACSRWPGGTLLVVKGVENMKRCFYKEERFLDIMNGKETDQVRGFVKEHPINGEEIQVGDGFEHDEEVGGEVFDNDENLSTHDIVSQLYSSKRGRNLNSTLTEMNPKIDPLSDVRTDNLTKVIDTEKQISVSKDDLIKSFKKIINNPQLDEKKRNKIKPLSESKDQNMEDTETVHSIKRKRSTHSHFTGGAPTNMESMMTSKGTFFFNINDTQDVTTGNSSFSSSEEFLRQCSRTVLTVDLAPYPDCKQRASVNTSDSSLRWSFRINATDNYYFIFSSDNSIEANVISFRLLIERRLYDLSEHIETQKCSTSDECVFPFSFMKSEGVIVDFNDQYQNISKLEDLNNYQILTICQPRSVVYTVFILLVPFIIILFAFR